MDMQSNYLEQRKSTRQLYKKLAAALLVVSVIIAIGVFWWLKLTGIAVTGEAFCEITEHIHSGECREYTLICTDESIGHEHTGECVEEALLCEISEHAHSVECYSDMQADKETAADWEQTFDTALLTGSAKENLFYIANTQLGYTESEANYTADENGNKFGYTRYGEWYGNPYGEWSAMFVSFCLNYGNIENADTLKNSGVDAMRIQWEKQGLYETAAFHSAQKGEIIFLDLDADGTADYAGVVSDFTNGIVTAIIGDWENAVSEVVLEDTSLILGYGFTFLPVAAQEEITEETTVEATTQEITEIITEQETTTSEEENISDTQETQQLTWDESIEKYKASLSEEVISELGGLSAKDQKRVTEMMYVIANLPSLDDFYTELDLLYESGDTDAEADYILRTQNQMIVAYVTYQGLDDLQSYVSNSDKLFELMDFYRNTQPTAYVTGVTEAVAFNYINHTWNINSWDTSVITPIIVHGGSVNEKVGNAVNRFWWGVVVEYDEANEQYYVGEVYEAEGNSSTSNAKILALEAETEKGFVILVWTADTSATTAQKTAYNVISTVKEGDYVNISIDPTTVTSGYNTSGYGNFYFTQPPTVEDKPLSDIQNGELSDDQVLEAGGKVTSPEGDVQISKSIDGTDIENVFDITLTVRTETNVQSYLSEPDMAVVIVMDISNTMNGYYPPTQRITTRYDAAIEAAENFINQFAKETSGISQLGFVSFNTSAQEIIKLQPCTTSNASALIQEMKDDTRAIIKSTGYGDSHERFTNVEAGLKRGYDMLASSGNANQYIIFLSDGFPTTYLKNGTTTYEGYDPYTGSGTKGADGVFYDFVTGYYCSSGTSYSDKASIRAREMATTIKSSGAKIFSIGVDVGGQTIAGYERTGLSIIDRTGTTYEIGDATSDQAYKDWLGNSIGSGYYYDSINKDQLANAFDNIFTEIKELNSQNRYTVWTSTDPLPVFDEKSSIIEFIHFYDLENQPAESLVGELGTEKENTAYHKDGVIYWDLKGSGYTTEEETVGDMTTTYYYYSLTYRVRLYNEAEKFEEYTPYETNGNAYLEYKTIVNTNGVNEISEKKVLNYPKPVVEGYYEEFSFIKQSDLGDPLAGATFTLTHDDLSCNECHGNGQPVTTVSELGPFTSEADGKVSFNKIPSGHIYTLEETVVPEGYTASGKIYKVTISMDKLTVRIYESADDKEGTQWTGDSLIIINPLMVYILPETGSVGILPFTISGLAIIAIPLLYCIRRRRKERRVL